MYLLVLEHLHAPVHPRLLQLPGEAHRVYHHRIYKAAKIMISNLMLATHSHL